MFLRTLGIVRYITILPVDFIICFCLLYVCIVFVFVLWVACIIFIRHIYFKYAICTLFKTKSVRVLALFYNGHIVLNCTIHFIV